MTTIEFLEQNNGLSNFLEEVARDALKVTDDAELSQAADDFLTSQKFLEWKLNKIGHEFG